MTIISSKLNLKHIHKKKSMWVLKILSGVHIGGEIQLDWHLYKVGSDNNNDIIIKDHNIADHHFNLELVQAEKASKIYVSPVNGVVKINEQEIKKRTQIKSFDLISLAGTFCVVGQNNIKWPQIVLPSLLHVKNIDPGQSNPDVATETARNTPRLSRTSRVRLKWLAVLFLLAIIGTISYFSLDWYYEQQRQHQLLLQQRHEYESVLRALDRWFNDNEQFEVKIIPDRHRGVINVTGYILSQQDLRKLHEDLLDNSSAEVLLHLFVVEDLLNQANSIINSMNLDLDIEYAGHGNVIVSGVLLKRYYFHKLENKLYESIQGLKAIYDEVIVISDLDLEINAVVVLPHKRYVVTEDNRILHEDDPINNSTKLQKITHEYLILNQNGLEIIFDFRNKKVRRLVPGN